jgi:deoxyribonuclease-4
MLLGAHVRGDEPLEEAAELGASCLQMFVGPPQSWKKPPPRPDAAELMAAELPIYVHAPYLINVASPNNRVRIPSRKILADTIERAKEIGAAGVIVHAGHAEDGVDKGFVRWVKVFEELGGSGMPILIENTAGGVNALGRYVDTLAKLFEHLEGSGAGFCFDTCHAHAAGEDLSDVVERVLDAVGRIDLVHCNDSRDAPGSGADRHANLAAGRIDTDVLVDMVAAALDGGASAVICETPLTGIADDLALLRERLGL